MKETRWVVRGIRLRALRNFIDHVVADAENELEQIEQRCLNGEYGSFEDYEGVQSAPVLRIQIASRAVGQELTSFVESELCAVAEIPWVRSNHKGPKTILELGENDHPRKLRMVSDLKIQEVIALVNEHYGIAVDRIEGWEDIKRLRDSVNTFKHRNGLKHFRDCAWGEKGFRFPQFEEITLQQAYDALQSVERFLLALDEATESGKEGDC